MKQGINKTHQSKLVSFFSFCFPKSADYLALGCSITNQHFVRELMILGIVRLKGPHTAEFVLQAIKEIIDPYNFNKAKCTAIVCDEGSNLRRAFRAIVSTIDDDLMYDQQGGKQAVSDQNKYEDDDAASNDSDDSDYEIDELESESESDDSDSDEETTSITRSADQSNSNASNSNSQYDSGLPSLAHADESDCVRMWDEFDPEPLYISPGRPYEQPVFSADATETTDETNMEPILNHFNLEIGKLNRI